MNKPDFASMNGDELLKAYNKLSVTKRKSKFKDLVTALKAVENAWEAKNKAAGKTSKAKGKGKTGETPEEVKRRNLQRSSMRIKVLTTENPRRPGTAAHTFFEDMKASATVGEYKDRYSDEKVRRDASQWLRYNQIQKHVELLPAA